MLIMISGLILLIGCAVLWALGGSVDKLIRRIGVGALIALLAVVSYILHGLSWYGIWMPISVFPLMWLMTSIGYGIPDNNDDGSPIGKFWWEFTGHVKFRTLLYTRLTVAILYAVAILPLACIGDGMFLLAAPLLVVNTILWSVFIEAPAISQIWNTEELLIGAGIGLASWLMIVV